MNSNPLTPPEKQRRINMLRIMLIELEQTPAITPCHLCGEFDPQNGYCAQWKASVPADAQAKGCEAWCEPIPF